MRRTPAGIDRHGNVMRWVPWRIQIAVWLHLPCGTCGRRSWLFSCRNGSCVHHGRFE